MLMLIEDKNVKRWGLLISVFGRINSGHSLAEIIARQIDENLIIGDSFFCATVSCLPVVLVNFLRNPTHQKNYRTHMWTILPARYRYGFIWNAGKKQISPDRFLSKIIWYTQLHSGPPIVQCANSWCTLRQNSYGSFLLDESCNIMSYIKPDLAEVIYFISSFLLFNGL